jgi:DNA modification methylase
MKIEIKKLSELKPAPYNPRQSNAEQEKQLKSSLEKFGVVEPIIFNKQTGYIVGGHFRIRELKKLGYKEIECVIVDLNEADEKELNIRLNANTGSWDWDELANNWDSELLSDWGLEIPGFEPTILEAEEDDFETPEGGIETDIVLGDLFEIGEHRLMCGDSTDSDSVAKLMNGEKADIMLIDPPYNINFKAQRSNKGYETHNDNLDNKDYLNLVTEIYNNAFLFTDKAIITCGKQNLKMWIENFNVTDIGIWIAKNKMSGGKISNLSLWEPILFIGKFDRNSRSNDLFEFNNKFQKEANEHPCPKVIDFFIELIKSYTKNSVLDFFIGSGTTMVASHQLKRKCYGMELDPKYCQVIIDRMKKLDPTLIIKRNGELIK